MANERVGDVSIAYNQTGTGITGGVDLALDATSAKARADDLTRHTAEFLGDILTGDLLAIYKHCFHLTIIIGAGVSQTLDNALIRILQIVLAYEGDTNLLGSLLSALQEVAPRS